MNYHVKKPTPQAFEFDVDGIIGNLISPELVTTDVKVADLRDANYEPNFQSDGIEFIEQASGVSDFESGGGWGRIYAKKISSPERESGG